MSHFFSRIAAIALMAIIGCMVAISLWQGGVADDRIEELKSSQFLTAAYTRANREILLADGSFKEYVAAGNPEVAKQAESHFGAFLQALSDIETNADADDRAFVQALRLHAEQSAIIYRQVLAAGADRQSVLQANVANFALDEAGYIEAATAGDFGSSAALLSASGAGPSDSWDSIMHDGNELALVSAAPC